METNTKKIHDKINKFDLHYMERCYNFPQFFVRIRTDSPSDPTDRRLRSQLLGSVEIVGSCHNVPAH